jgi:hypothetical protein
MYIPSLAASTGTRMDSAAKHNMACKVDTKIIKSWMMPGGDLDKRLHTERMRFAVQKDELVMNVAYRMFETSSYNAYPAITSNLSEMTKDVQKVVWGLYAQPNPSAFKNYSELMKDLKHGGHTQAILDRLKNLKIEVDNEADLKKNAKQFGHMPFFRAQGYALGTGYASSVSGDTVCTVMVGGMHSCMNGAFTFHAGDLVQWYFTGEEDLFQHGNTGEHEDGERLAHYRDNRNNPHSRKRNRDYHDRYAFGSEPIKDNHKSHAVFRIKPYRMCRDNDGNYRDHYGDKVRVFAKCIGGARPYEMMDIMLMTQSL